MQIDLAYHCTGCWVCAAPCHLSVYKQTCMEYVWANIRRKTTRWNLKKAKDWNTPSFHLRQGKRLCVCVCVCIYIYIYIYIYAIFSPETSKRPLTLHTLASCHCIVCAHVWKSICVEKAPLGEVDVNSQLVWPPLTSDFSFCPAESSMCVFDDYTSLGSAHVTAGRQNRPISQVWHLQHFEYHISVGLIVVLWNNHTHYI